MYKKSNSTKHKVVANTIIQVILMFFMTHKSLYSQCRHFLRVQKHAKNIQINEAPININLWNYTEFILFNLYIGYLQVFPNISLPSQKT